MYERLRCISLRTVKYDDRRSIVTVWSAERGRMGLIVPAGSSRGACRLRAIMMPMGLFEGEVDIRPGRDLMSIRDVRPLAVLSSMSSSPAKAVVALFLAEVLERILRESAPDRLLSEFIFGAVEMLDATPPRGVDNFPLIFLCKLGEFLGISPDVAEWRPGSYFDMTGGVYRRSAPTSGRWLGPREAATAAILQRLEFSTAARLGIDKPTRRAMLDAILEYYTIHLAPLDSLRSLEVLRTL